MDREPSPQLADQRRSERRTLEAPVRVEVPEQALEAVSDNTSTAGILLFSEEPIRVSITVDGPDGVLQRSGRIVRVQRMGDGRSGLAVEFDDAD